MRGMQRTTARLLRIFDLSHAELRFMQTATMSILSGPAIPWLFNDSVTVTHLDFYAPPAAYSLILRFFSLTTSYCALPQPQRARDGVHHTISFRNPRGQIINVMCSKTRNALHCMPYEPFTHLVGAVTHLGAWFAYPTTSTAMLALPNRASTDHLTATAIKELAVTVWNYQRAGYSFEFDFPTRHICGVSFECPLTTRTTSDDGCLNIFFAGPPYGVYDRPRTVYPDDSELAWSLEGRPCSTWDAGTSSSSVIQRQDALCELYFMLRDHLTRLLAFVFLLDTR